MAKKKTTGIVGQFTINGKPVQITDSWDKCTFSQYLAIMKMQDEKELLSIITGIPYEDIKNAKISGLEKLLHAAGFINTIPDIPKTPKKVGPFKLPLNSKGIFDVQFESLAQFEDMRMIMGKTDLKNPYELTKSYGIYCAIYLQKMRDKEYDGDNAMSMVPEIMEYPALEVISAGSFFLSKLLSLLIGTLKNYQNTAPTRNRNIGKTIKKSSGFRQRSTKRAKR